MPIVIPQQSLTTPTTFAIGSGKYRSTRKNGQSSLSLILTMPRPVMSIGMVAGRVRNGSARGCNMPDMLSIKTGTPRNGVIREEWPLIPPTPTTSIFLFPRRMASTTKTASMRFGNTRSATMERWLVQSKLRAIRRKTTCVRS